MTRHPRRGALLAAAALVLGGCTGGNDAGDTTPEVTDPTPAASSSPTAGTLVGRDTFAVTLPDGWLEQDAGEAVLLAVSDDAIDGFATNLNVVEDSTLAGLGADDLQTAIEQIAVASDATDVGTPVEVEVDGEPAARLGSLEAVGSVDVRSEQIAVTRGDTGYIVTISFSPSTTQEARDTTVDEIMTTWTWAG